jgi:hypothetical protein
MVNSECNGFLIPRLEGFFVYYLNILVDVVLFITLRKIKNSYLGFYASYDGHYDVTQWIYNEEVKLSWKTSGPDFRGIITKDFIFGIQRARFT